MSSVATAADESTHNNNNNHNHNQPPGALASKDSGATSNPNPTPNPGMTELHRHNSADHPHSGTGSGSAAVALQGLSLTNAKNREEIKRLIEEYLMQGTGGDTMAQGPEGGENNEEGMGRQVNFPPYPLYTHTYTHTHTHMHTRFSSHVCCLLL